MKNVQRLADHGLFVARSPLLPLAIFRQWAAAPDKRRFLLEMYQQPLLKDALYLASPTLFDRYQQAWQAQAAADATGPAGVKPETAQQKLARQQEEKKLEHALSKYLARAAFRCTPFGLFATVTAGKVAAETGLAALSAAPIVPRVRFDFALQGRIVKWLLSDPALREKLSYRVNDSLSAHGGKIYYVEGVDNASHKQYQFTQVEQESYLDFVLALARVKTPFHILQSELAAHAGASTAEAGDYLHELIASEILVPDLGLQITGGGSFAALLDKLTSINEQQRVAVLAQWLDGLERGAQSSGWAQQLEQVWQSMAALQQFEVPRKNVFQVDARRMAGITLAQGLVQRIGHVAALLARVTGRRSNILDDFKTRFAQRYEDKEVPLTMLFNDEIGIPFPRVGKPISDLLSGIDFPGVPRDEAGEVKWDLFDRLMFRKFEAALKQGLTEISLDEQDFQVFDSAKTMPLQGGMFAVATLFGQDAGQHGEPGIFLQSMGGRTGVELLGRFCDLDADLTAQVRSIIGKIDQDDDTKIHAEVVHLPQDRIVNVVARPVLSNYEIPYLGYAGVFDEQQIMVADLMISLRQNRFVLRSQRMNREVIPRLTSAHNYTGNNLNLYRFLCSLWLQDQPVQGFHWSQVFRASLYLPRVSIAGVVVSLATWRLDKGALAALRVAASADADALRAWRNERSMPRFISRDVADNVLPVDLENGLMVTMFLDEIGEEVLVEVKESIILNADAPRGELGAHNVEVVIPYQVVQPEAVKHPVHAPLAHAVTAEVLSPERMKEPYLFVPGSAWTYFKLYCGQSQVDELVSRHIAPLMRQSLRDNLISQWFFIRYSDPEHHIRIRARSDDLQGRQAVSDALSAMSAAALQQGFCWKVSVDSYERETRRYGGLASIGHCEALFHVDSELIVDFIQSAEAQIPVSRRWLFAVLCVSELLAAFALDLAQKADLIDKIAESFRREFHFGARQKVQLGAKYRSYRAGLDRLVFGRGAEGEEAELRVQWQVLLEKYRPAVQQHAMAIRALADSGKLAGHLDVIISSLIHMHCNRLFIADQRSHEVVFYDFMDRILGSLQAAARSGAAPR